MKRVIIINLAAAAVVALLILTLYLIYNTHHSAQLKQTTDPRYHIEKEIQDIDG